MFQVSGDARINHVGLKVSSGGGQSEKRKSSDHQTEELQMWPLHINASNREARVRRGADEPRPASFPSIASGMTDTVGEQSVSAPPSSMYSCFCLWSATYDSAFVVKHPSWEGKSGSSSLARMLR